MSRIKHLTGRFWLSVSAIETSNWDEQETQIKKWVVNDKSVDKYYNGYHDGFTVTITAHNGYHNGSVPL